MSATTVPVEQRDERDYVTPSQIAEQVGVHPATIRRLIADGTLTPAYRTPRGHARFARTELAGIVNALRGGAKP